MQAAQAEFDQAASAGDSIFLKPFEIVPVVGRQVRSVDALTSSAAQVVHTGIEAMESSTARLQEPTAAGADRIRLVTELGAIAAKARQQLRGLDLGPSQALVGPLHDARDKFAKQLNKARTSMADVDDASKGVAQMAQGPSKYLVLAANNGEMRAGSGMLLSAGVMTLNNGKFDLGPMTDTGCSSSRRGRSRCRRATWPTAGAGPIRARSGATSRCRRSSGRTPRSRPRCGRRRPARRWTA